MKMILVAIILVQLALGPDWAQGHYCVGSDVGPICTRGPTAYLGASKHRVFVDRACLLSRLAASRRSLAWSEFEVRATYVVLTNECDQALRDLDARF